ncbi:DUF3021 domain-containing protein [Companilactobacillus sp.]|jgi:hypothetical protein|uniref:DUF3021 domain-containing protein n=1 Tax=Companilactobacillus sp. TaxID=2767905 RepID=UPI0025BCC1BC|nr:DUF3021 domain-containing protein [Companilactobacillus sp.]MCH4009423.1 DUF3021 domain-containing protein [Companilactobacillus sp.]MCH4050398.1 DUF3021 domain-containing protein [Companilactobacillus sp.]MCH4077365.1 DUF3021 domain-containing protein [Companilactobacillus sp.]MCH4125941.1 DUF3021 domain-containing protein [Companilactobacillus sp.]MCI1311650.1 DUF3021 domain-containing protein [Companilactobacillus sp.]
MLKKMCRYTLIGLLIGSLTYLILLATQGNSHMITRTNIISVLIMSALIGLVSSIFELDWNPLITRSLHLIVTFGLVTITSIFNQWWPNFNKNLIASFFGFLIIYILVWVGLYVADWADAKRMNQKLRTRNK